MNKDLSGELYLTLSASLERSSESLESTFLTEIKKLKERINEIEGLFPDEKPIDSIQSYLSEQESMIQKYNEGISRLKELTKLEQIRLENSLSTALSETKSAEETESLLRDIAEQSIRNVTMPILRQLHGTKLPPK